MKTIITISREYGSGGLEAGKKLAEKLNIPLYNRELLTLIAKESGLSEKKADEAQSDDIPFSIQAEIIRKTAQTGPCVLVGCCADYVLRDEKNVFNVFIYADKFHRMDRIVQKYRMEPEQAANYIIKKDKERALYYNLNTSLKWGDPENYHLNLDSAATDTDGIAELIHAEIAKQEAFERRKGIHLPYVISASIV